MIQCCRCQKDCPYADTRDGLYECYECRMIRGWARGEPAAHGTPVVNGAGKVIGHSLPAKTKRRPVKIGDFVRQHRPDGIVNHLCVEKTNSYFFLCERSIGPVNEKQCDPGFEATPLLSFWDHEDGTLIAFPGVTYED